MSEHELRSRPAKGANSRKDSVVSHETDSVPLATEHETGEYTDTLAQFEREQLARAYADIERASAALRRAEPALELSLIHI